MSLTFAHPPAIRDVEKRIAQGLRHIGQRFSSNERSTLVGPVPIYSLAQKPLKSRGQSRWAASGQWRGLVMAGEFPIATIQAGEPFDGRSTSVRGEESARAFHASLLKAVEIGSATDKNFQVRFVVIPGAFLTAVWLYGRRSIFIPTRIGPGARPKLKEYSTENFARLINRLRQKVKQSTSPKTAYR